MSITKRVGFLGRSSLLEAGVLALLAFSSTGCGALGALTNPKAAWALNESAPMSVVVRRAEVASMTSEQVDRLLGQTALDSDSKWVQGTAIKKDDAKALLEGIAADDTYAAGAKGGKLRVAPAEAWYSHFSGICSKEKEHENLLAATSGTLATTYKEVAAMHGEIAALKSEKAELELSRSAKGASEETKAEIDKQVEALEAKIDKAEDAIDPKKDAFLVSVREEAGKADEATKKRVGVALINLRRAVDDAKTMNSVALLRYPMAVTSLHEDVLQSAKRVVADVIEEQTGKRPDMSALKPEVKLEGTDVKLTLNGLSASELLSLKPDELIEETTLRLSGYVGRVLTLIAFADETQNRLTFQGKVLDAWIDGMKLSAATVQSSGDELDLVVETTTAKKATENAGDKSRHTHGGLRTTRCDTAKRETVAEVVSSDPKQKKTTKNAAAATVTTKKSVTKPASVTQSSSAPPTQKTGGSQKDEPCIVLTNGDGSFCL